MFKNKKIKKINENPELQVKRKELEKIIGVISIAEKNKKTRCDLLLELVNKKEEKLNKLITPKNKTEINYDKEFEEINKKIQKNQSMIKTLTLEIESLEEKSNKLKIEIDDLCDQEEYDFVNDFSYKVNHSEDNTKSQ